MSGTLSRLRPPTPSRGSESSRPAGDHLDTVTIALLPIAADLLPRHGATSRSGRAVRFVAVAVVLVALVATAGGYLLANRSTSAATDDLQRAQERETSLMSQQHRYDDLVQTQHLTAAIHAKLAPLMAGDVPWATTLQAVADAVGDVGLTSVTGSVPTPKPGADSTSGTPTSQTSTSATSTGSTATTIGTLSISGYAGDKPAIADFMEAIAARAGLANPFLTDVNESSETHQFTFTLTVDVTSAIRGDTPARWADTGSHDGSAK